MSLDIRLLRAAMSAAGRGEYKLSRRLNDLVGKPRDVQVRELKRIAQERRQQREARAKASAAAVSLHPAANMGEGVDLVEAEDGKLVPRYKDRRL